MNQVVCPVCGRLISSRWGMANWRAHAQACEREQAKKKAEAAARESPPKPEGEKPVSPS